MAAAAGVTAVAVVVAAAALVGTEHGEPRGPVPGDPRDIGVGVPVWYDAKGLHHGDAVEQTPVEIMQLEPPPDRGVEKGALALVRSGAVYLDPATGDVWFHPWGGKPRIVGRNSAAGPGGDPNGDTAAWFDGSELVVYDTTAGREISRTRQRGAGDASRGGGEYFPTGNGFLQVSAERIRWRGEYGWYSHNVHTRSTSEVPHPKGGSLADIHDDVKVLDRSGLTISAPGRVEGPFATLSTHARLSPSGNYVLAPEKIAPDYTIAPDAYTRHGPAIVDSRTGELWRLPKDGYPWIAWSYDDVAVIGMPGGTLLSCDAARRACETLRPEGPALLPTS